MHLLPNLSSAASVHTYESFLRQDQQSTHNSHETRSADRSISYESLQTYEISELNSSLSVSQALDLHSNSEECSVLYGYDNAGYSLPLFQFYGADIIPGVHPEHNSEVYLPIPGNGTTDTKQYGIYNTILNDLIFESGSFSTSFFVYGDWAHHLR